jgi:uncharacterized protein YecT (DUF1311 family)
MPLSLLFLGLASAAAPPVADAAGQFRRCLKQASSMLEDAACYVAEQARLDNEQKALLGALVARLKPTRLAVTDYPPAVKGLAKAQAAWTAYRDADCEIMDHVFGDGNAEGLASATCMIDHYTARNAVLRNQLKELSSHR